MVAGGDKEINIKVVVDAQGAVKVFNDLGEEIDKTGKKTEKADSSFGKLGAAIVTLNQGVQLLGSAFRTVTGLAGTLFSSLEEAGRIEGLTTSFDNLQESVGNFADETLAGLRTATQGLVSDLDLIQQANQAVLLGLPTEGFDDLAAAAVKLGAATGRTATEALSDLVTGLGRSSALILDNLGIIVKASEAQTAFADSIGVTVDALTEEQKAQAFRFLAIEKIQEANERLADVEITAARAATQVTVAVENQTSAFLQAFSGSETLGGSLSDLADTIAGIDIEQFAADVAGLTAIFIDLANITLPFVIRQFEAFNDGLSVVAVIVSDLADKRFPNLARAQDVVAKSKVFESLERGSERARKSFDKLNKILEQTGKETSVSSKIVEQAEKAFDKLSQTVEAGTADQELFNIALEVFGPLLDDLKDKSSDAAGAFGVLAKEIKKTTDEAGKKKAIDELAKSLEEIDKIIDRLTGVDGVDDLTQIFGQLKVQLDAGIITNEQFRESIKNLIIPLSDTAENAKLATDALRGIPGAISDINKTGVDSDLFTGISEGIGQAIGQGLKDAFGALFAGDFNRDVLTDLGGELGSIVGASFGEKLGEQLGEKFSAQLGDTFGDVLGPIGEALGSELGSFVGEQIVGGIVGAFGGGEDPGKLSREALDDFFDDLLDPARLKLVIDGNLQEIESFLVNEVGKFGVEGAQPFEGFFENLDLGTAQGIAAFEGFAGVGRAFADILREIGIAGEQVGGILANNLGGSLNNLQLLLQATGVSLESLKEAINEAFLAGTISAKEFLSSQRGIENVFKQGIPDGIGLVNKAFENLVSGGIASGRLALDALGDLAVEAIEKGLPSLEALQQSLIEAGFDVDDVTNLFEQLGAQGIKSLEDLKTIGLEQTAAVISALEDLGFAFEDPIEKAEDLKETLDAITDKEVDITFNFRSNFDANTQTAVNNDMFEASGSDNPPRDTQGLEQ